LSPDHWLDAVLNIVFPCSCIVCGSTETRWRSGAICPDCEAALRPLVQPYCHRCGLASPAIEGLCGRCITGETRYELGRAALRFDARLRTIIHHFKYNDRVSLARPLGRAMRQCLDANSFNPDLVVPVPLHRRRERERGYNQSALLAASLDLKVDARLVRRRVDTGSQTGKSLPYRLRNVRGAFECAGPVRGSILLVDDVQTTGATVNEIARVLKKNGADRVEVLTAARVADDGWIAAGE
jgi:ComF family protein